MRKTILLSGLIQAIFIGLLSAQSTYYVKSNGTGDGSSWSNAMGDLQLAINTASDEATNSGEMVRVFVAAGTYVPTVERKTGDPRSVSFVMRNKVEIYGGFSSTGDPTFTDRDPGSYPTILSADIGKADSLGDNAYQLIRNDFDSDDELDSTAILDGFILEKAYSEGGSSIYGTAIFCYYASPVFRNCSISSEDGSLIYMSRSSATFSGCSMNGFSGDEIMHIGAGKEDDYVEVRLVNCEVKDNDTENPLIEVNYYATIIVDSCLFSGNQATSLSFNWYTNCLVENSVFENNYSPRENAGVFLFWTAENSDYYIIRNSSFIGNVSGYSGGIIYATSSDPIEISNCLFANNSTEDGDAGVAYMYSTDFRIDNCTFFNNTVHGNGSRGATFVNSDYFQGELIINNSIIWGEQGDQIAIISDAPTTVTNSLVKLADGEVALPGENNLNEYPQFVDSTAGDFRLKSFSPCINAGSNELYVGDFLKDVDLWGNPRFYEDGVIDMGCHEYQGAKTTISVGENILTENLSVYPNPATSTLNVEVGGEQVQCLQIFTNTGRLVSRTENPGSELDISTLAPGLYLLKANTGASESTARFIKLDR